MDGGAYDAECAERPLGARIGADTSPGTLIRVAGSLGSVSPYDLPSWATYTERDQRWASPLCGLHQVITYGQGAVRPGASPAPLSDDDLWYSQSLPGRARRPAPIVAVLRELSGLQRRWTFDWGQTVEVQSAGLALSWMAPSAIVRQDAFLNYPTDPGQIIVEMGLAAVVQRCEESRCARRVTLTTPLVVAANAREAVEVPLGAVSVQLRRDDSALGATLAGWWTMGYGYPNVTPSKPTASIRFEQGQSLVTSIAPHVTHLQAPQIPDSACWILSWEIEL